MPNKTYRATHRTGTAVTLPLKITTKRGRGFRLKVANLDASEDMEISFDSGNTFFPIPAGTVFEEDIVFHFFYVRRVSGAGSDVAFSAMLFEG